MSDNGMTKHGGPKVMLVNNTDARITGAMHLMLVAHAQGAKLAPHYFDCFKVSVFDAHTVAPAEFSPGEQIRVRLDWA